MNPFHLAVTVNNLDAAREFYTGLLGCRESFAAEAFFDIDFFGNLLTLHIGEHLGDADTDSKVDGKVVPIPHFGCVLSREDFDRVVGRLRDNGIEFYIEPGVRYEGEPLEQTTMFVRDPSGNALEFKTYSNPDALKA